MCVHSQLWLALIPGSCAGEEERELGTHSSRMHQVLLITCILLRYTKITTRVYKSYKLLIMVDSVYLLKGRSAGITYTPYETHMSCFEGKTISL